MKHSTARVGIAIGDGAIVGTVHAGTVLHSVTLAIAAGESGALHDAFTELRARLSGAADRDLDGAAVALTLLPPQADARLIALPPLRRAEAAAVIRRDAARHFIGAAGARVVAVRMPHALARRRADAAPVLAVAASAQLLDAARAAAVSAGWHVTTHTAAYGVWLALAEQTARRARAADRYAVVAVVGDTAHVLRVERGAVTVLRRLPAGDAPDIVGALGSGAGSLSLFAGPGDAERLERALAAVDWTVVRAGTAAEVAAAHASMGALALVPSEIIAGRERRQHRIALQLAGAAVLLLVGAAAVHVWGAQRELSAVQAERAAIRPQVLPLLETRDSLDRLRERTDAFHAAATPTQWTRALFDVALLLPADAHVLSVRGMGDTLLVSAEGARAGAALQALRTAGSLRSVQLRGPIEREIEAGATTLERFTLDARLAADSSRPRSQ